MCVLDALRTFSRTVRKQNESSGKGTGPAFSVTAQGKVSPGNQTSDKLPTIHVASEAVTANLFSWSLINSTSF